MDAVVTQSTRMPAAAAVRLRRNPKWMALGIVAICLGALGSFVLYNQLADTRQVVAVTSTVYRGGTIEASDLTAVRIGETRGVRTVPAADLDALVGQRATVDLMGGTLLAPGAIAPTVVPATGHSLVGVKLAVGRAPSGFLQPSSPVRLIAIPPQGSSPGFKDSYSDVSIDATVVDVRPSADGQATVMDVDVASAQAPQAATLAATDRLVAVRDPER